MEREGFFAKSQPPQPREKPWKGRAVFMDKLHKIETKASIRQHTKIRKCRICNARLYTAEYSKDKWTWPMGTFHYVEAHNVKPSEAFISFVEGAAK